MSVYVDPAVWPYGNMTMCHMIADTHEELVAMADLIGVKRKWIQKEGTPGEHFDICKSKRLLAVKSGAIEIDWEKLVEILRKKRLPNPPPRRK